MAKPRNAKEAEAANLIRDCARATLKHLDDPSGDLRTIIERSRQIAEMAQDAIGPKPRRSARRRADPSNN